MRSTASKRHPYPKIRPGRTMIEMMRLIWHLSPIFFSNIATFLVLATTMHYFGGLVNTVDHAPVSFGETLYMCGVTGLTIGYGDIVPTTPVGRAVAVSVAFLGVLLTGLITSVAVLAVQRAAAHQESDGE
jgi:voltage-gated potassium channel